MKGKSQGVGCFCVELSENKVGKAETVIFSSTEVVLFVGRVELIAILADVELGKFYSYSITRTAVFLLESVIFFHTEKGGYAKVFPAVGYAHPDEMSSNIVYVSRLFIGK